MWNIEQIRPYFKKFNGKIIITIATDSTTECISLVRDRIGSCVNNIEMNNDPRNGGTMPFLKALKFVASTTPGECTFYAHAKGVKYQLDDWRMQNIRKWVTAMLRINLFSLRRIDSVLSAYQAAGCFKSSCLGGDVSQRHGGWHYSGAFFWFKHDYLFARQWENCDDNYYGVENYLSKHIPNEMAYDLSTIQIRDFYSYGITEQEIKTSCVL